MVFQMPVIKIELDYMKQSIVTALADYTGELSEFVDAEIKKAIDEFDFSSVVQPMVHDSIRLAIRSYFLYGEGSTLITSAVGEALNEIFKPQSN